MITPEFISHSGASIVSKNILTGRGRLTWLVREGSTNPADNGWRFFADIDDEAYLDDPNNLEVASFNRIAEIEPAVIGIYAFPVGSDLQLRRDGARIRFFDNLTGVEVSVG